MFSVLQRPFFAQLGARWGVLPSAYCSLHGHQARNWRWRHGERRERRQGCGATLGPIGSTASRAQAGTKQAARPPPAAGHRSSRTTRGKSPSASARMVGPHRRLCPRRPRPARCAPRPPLPQSSTASWLENRSARPAVVAMRRSTQTPTTCPGATSQHWVRPRRRPRRCPRRSAPTPSSSAVRRAGTPGHCVAKEAASARIILKITGSARLLMAATCAHRRRRRRRCCPRHRLRHRRRPCPCSAAST